MQRALQFLALTVTVLTISVQCTPIHQDIEAEGEAQAIPEPPEKADEKSRQFGFLNGLNAIGALVGLRPSLGGNRMPAGNGISATTPRLNGRPGLGFIPDVTKGVNTILDGVASGNLEKILEGSFVFAPNGVQLVAGSVLDRVFLSTSPSPPTTDSPKQQAPPTRTLTAQEAQKQLLQIIQEQQKKINALENLQKTEAPITVSQE